METDERLVQPENVPPKEVTELPMVAEVSPVQPINTSFPKEITVSGMTTEERLEQLQNADSPMVVMELPKATEAKP